MKNITGNLLESISKKNVPYYTIQVESTTDIQAWAPTLFEIQDDNLIEVLSSIKFNDDGTKIIQGTTDLSHCGFNILITAQKFKELLGFFAERTKQGDIISIWVSVPEFEELIDKIAETDDTTQHAEKEIEKLSIEEIDFNKIKSSNPEELAAEIISFAKQEFPDQEYERPVPAHVIINSFWRSKNINHWNLSADLKFLLRKAGLLVQKQQEKERENKRNEKMLSLVNPCLEWAKEHGLKKVTENDIIAFLSDKGIDLSPRTQKRALQALVNNKITSL